MKTAVCSFNIEGYFLLPTRIINFEIRLVCKKRPNTKLPRQSSSSYIYIRRSVESFWSNIDLAPSARFFQIGHPTVNRTSKSRVIQTFKF